MEQETEKFDRVRLDIVALAAALVLAGLTLWVVSLSSPLRHGDTGVWWVTAALVAVSLFWLLPSKTTSAVLFSVGNWLVAVVALFVVPADLPVRTPLLVVAVTGPVFITVFGFWRSSMKARIRRLAGKKLEEGKATGTPEVFVGQPSGELKTTISSLPAAGAGGLPAPGATHERVDGRDVYWDSPVQVAMRAMAEDIYPTGQLHHVLVAEDDDDTLATMKLGGFEFSGSPVDFLHYCGSMVEVIDAQATTELDGFVPFGAVVKFHPAIAHHRTTLVGVFEGGHYQVVVIGDEDFDGEFDIITKSPEVKSTLDMLFSHTGMYAT